MRFGSLSIFAGLLLLCSAAITKADPGGTLPRTITTSGEATVFVTPDEVIVNFGVETFDESLDKAKATNDEQSAKLVKAIKAVGVDDKHLQTDTMSIEMLFRENRPWQGIRGYVTHRAYSVTLKDTKLFEKLIDASLKNGANQLSGFEFRTTELRKYRDQARSLAIKAAKEKAVALAKDLECGVGRPWQITENGYSYYGGYNSNSFGNNAQVAVQGPAGGDESETLPLGQIAVRASVGVVFDLTDK